MKDPIKVKRGKKSKAQGSAFELRVRKDLEEKGWIVDKFTNNVEFGSYTGIGGEFEPKKYNECILKDGTQVKSPCAKLIQAKPHMVFNPTIKRMIPLQTSSGFPDFICFRVSDSIGPHNYYEVIGVESKLKGELDREEKEKCRWLLDNGIFNKILIAKKTKIKNRVVVVYEDFIEIEKRMKKDRK